MTHDSGPDGTRNEKVYFWRGWPEGELSLKGITKKGIIVLTLADRGKHIEAANSLVDVVD